MAELKLCPFCGGKGKVSYKDYKFGGWNGKSDARRKYRVQVICNKCRARGKPIISDWIVNYSPYQTAFWDKDSRHDKATEAFRPYVEKAIEAWNRRYDNERIIEVPPHGRLIDADALMDELQELFDKREKEAMFTGDRNVGVSWNDAIFHIKVAPTIIEAEGE